MMEKKILGLDLGTNSIGWAVLEGFQSEDFVSLIPKSILGAGSRIIPMSQDVLTDFEKGKAVSQTKARTAFRGVRRLRERNLLRRERLHRVLSLMGFLPEHYACQIDRYGKFINSAEPKLPWTKDESGNWTFLFKDSFEEMLAEFQDKNPDSAGEKVPYDWTIYYLRKKALTSAISKYELAWLLLNFNHKRGYYQLRGEDDGSKEDDNTQKEYIKAKVVSVTADETKANYYNIIFDSGDVYNKKQGKVPLDSWVGQEMELIKTTKFNKKGEPIVDYSAPKEGDWGLVKIRTEKLIENSRKSVGEYIYDTLLANPDQKINGKLITVVERKFYKDELHRILEKQKEFHKELQDETLCQQCYEELYAHNVEHRKSMLALSSNRNEGAFTTLFVDDIIFYQRPLKSKKSSVSDCSYEYHEYKDKNGNVVREYQKCISKYHPLFQEFRLWQFLSNLKIYKKREDWEKNEQDIDVTDKYLPAEEKWVQLYDYLSNKETISMKSLLESPVLGLAKKTISFYRWNYVEDAEFLGNEVHAKIVKFLKKCNLSETFLSAEDEYMLWQILYSVDSKDELRTALSSFANKRGIIDADTFVDVFVKFPPFEKSYGSYSAKAIKRLLPLMRRGKYWSAENIDAKTKDRIQHLITGEVDETIGRDIYERFSDGYHTVEDFKGLPLHLACYLVYGRHSEVADITKWETPEDIDAYLNKFKQYSLRNPVVEQVVLETLRVVRDIWRQYGSVDEIHLEMGRDLKNPSKKRKEISAKNAENQQRNFRIKALLTALANDFHYEGAKAYSPSQQEILQIYEEGAVEAAKLNGEYTPVIEKIIKDLSNVDEKKRPSRKDVERYVSWLEQKYRSPYTGRVIPLSRLFTSDYEIEHVIPQSRYFDDSMSNKVICESAVNRLKSNQLAMEFIKNHHGEVVPLGNGETAKVFDVEEYQLFVSKNYGSKEQKIKREKLLMEEIPEGFIERQMNDSRYISKFIKGLLSNIVRVKDADGNLEQEATSKNLIATNGTVTTILKQAWGVNEAWNKIILPRFIRMNEKDPDHTYTEISAQGHLIPSMPLVYQYNFNKKRKRIDHRHHAMDAIVIACSSREIVNYLSNMHAAGDGKNRYALRHKLCDKKKDTDGYERLPRVPWFGFQNDVFNVLNSVIASFKQNLRVINKATNKYTRYNEEGKKVVVSQEGENWAIRKSLHKDTVFGLVNLQMKETVSLKEAITRVDRICDKDLKRKLKELLSKGLKEKEIKNYFDENSEAWQDVNLKKIEVFYYTEEKGKKHYYATRFISDLVTLFKDVTNFKAAEDQILKITDSGIQKILFNHIAKCNNDVAFALSPEGIDLMNKNIVELNNGKQHKPIYKVRKFESAEGKYSIGQTGNKKDKFVEADKGTNLFFVAYEDKDGKLSYDTLSLNVAIDRMKRGENVAPETDAEGRTLRYVISPNDLVMVEHNGEKYIYKMVSSSGNQCFFVPSNVASPIVNKVEYSPLNKFEKDENTGEMIKAICTPIKVDRLGNIVSIKNKQIK